MTQTDSPRDIFLMRRVLRFALAVLSDEVGTAPLCAAAESIRWQWPYTRILILGRIPAMMTDQLYDDVAVHSVDEKTLLCAIDKLAENLWTQKIEALPPDLQGPGTPLRAAYAMDRRESDPSKIVAAIPQGVHARDLPSGQYRLNRRG